MQSRNKGFTLVELLVVIGIVGILLAITLVAINPARQFAQTNNAKRMADVNAILNAITQLKVENKGVLPTGVTIPSSATVFNNTNSEALCSAIVPTFIAALPFDPTATGASWGGACTSFDTGYEISQSAEGRVTVTATAEAIDGVAPAISVTR